MTARLRAASTPAATLLFLCLACGGAAPGGGTPSLAVLVGTASVSAGGASALPDALVGASSSVTYTLVNNGTATWSSSGIAIGGSGASAFAVTTNPDASVPSGGHTSFTITFTPGAAGASQATVAINGNASFSFSVSANGTAKPIANLAVTVNENPVVSGGAAVDFGTVLTSHDTSKTFTIASTGSTALTLSAVSVTSGASEFSISSQPTSPIAASRSTTFTVTFAPSGSGHRVGSVTIVNSSESQPGFVINITGNGAQATTGITVTGAGGAASVAGPGNTLQLSATVAPAGASSALTWSTNTPAVATVDASGLVLGNKLGTATITATANDGTNVSGSLLITVTPPPIASISVAVGTNSVASGGAAVDLGDVITTSSATTTFTVSNGGGLAMAISSASVTNGSSYFSITAAPASSVDALGSTTFQVKMTPGGLGECAGTITLENSSVNHPEFVINLSGTGVQGATSVSVNGTSSIVGLGNTTQLSSTVAPANAAQSVTWSSGTPSVATVDQTGLVTSFGTGNTLITATANDGSGISGSLNVSVSLPPTPEIAVSVAGTPVISGGAAVDFGQVATVGAGTITFTLSNPGTGALAVSSASVTSNATEFSIIQAPASTVAALGSTTFVVRFAPSTTGMRTGAITIADSSSDQPTFVVNLSGTCVPPVSEIDLSGPGGLTYIVGAGNKLQLTATVLPATAIQNVTWNSGTAATATINASGVITAVNPGTSLITATSTDGSGTIGTLTISVVAPTNTAAFVKQVPPSGTATTSATTSSGTILLSSAYSTSGNAFKFEAPNYYGTVSNGFVTLPFPLSGDFSVTATLVLTSTPKVNGACGVGVGLTTGFAATDRYAYVLMSTQGNGSARYVNSATNVTNVLNPQNTFTIGAPGTGTVLSVVFSRSGSTLTYGWVGNTVTTATSTFTDGTTIYAAGSVYPAISFNNVAASVSSFVVTDGAGNTLFDSSSGTLAQPAGASLALGSDTASVAVGATTSDLATAIAITGATASVSAVAADPTVVDVSVTNNASSSSVALQGLKSGTTTVTVTNLGDPAAGTKTITVSVN